MDSGLAGTRSQACAGCVNLPVLPAPRNDESEFTRVGLIRLKRARAGGCIRPARRGSPPAAITGFSALMPCSGGAYPLARPDRSEPDGGLWRGSLHGGAAAIPAATAL